MYNIMPLLENSCTCINTLLTFALSVFSSRPKCSIMCCITPPLSSHPWNLSPFLSVFSGGLLGLDRYYPVIIFWCHVSHLCSIIWLALVATVDALMVAETMTDDMTDVMMDTPMDAMTDANEHHLDRL
jgi:hypothetical protein